MWLEQEGDDDFDFFFGGGEHTLAAECFLDACCRRFGQFVAFDLGVDGPVCFERQADFDPSFLIWIVAQILFVTVDNRFFAAL